MIRDAILSDVPRLVEMGLRFLRGSKYRDFLEENPAKLAEFIAARIGAADGKVLVYENGNGITGMLAFLAYPHPYSGEFIAAELAWWVDPEARGRQGLLLLKAAEQQAKEMGAARMQVVAPSREVAKIYRHFGYEEIETNFQRNLQ